MQGCRGAGVQVRRMCRGVMCRGGVLSAFDGEPPLPLPRPLGAISPFDWEPALVLVAACEATLWPEGRDRDLVGVRVRVRAGVGVEVRGKD